MQKSNLTDLHIGLNKIVITQDMLDVVSGKIPIARIPPGRYLIDLLCDVEQPFVASAIPSNVLASVPASDLNTYSMSYRFKLGIASDEDYFMEEINPTVIGEYGANSGTYFDDPTNFEVPCNIHLDSSIIPRTWTFGGDLNTARYATAGCGTQTSGLCFGGTNGSIFIAPTEEYDGSSWTTTNNLNTARSYLTGFGTQTAGLSAAGGVSPYNQTEEYDGTCWAASNNLNLGRTYSAGFGIQSAGVCCAGGNPETTSTEEYDGTSWTAVNDTNEAKNGHTSFGIQSAGVSCGGQDPALSSHTEEYNGTNWVYSNDLNVARGRLSSAGFQTSGLSFGASTGSTTEEYDGSTWIYSNDVNFGVGYAAGFGTQSAAIRAGCYITTITEEYNEIDMQTVVLSGKMVLNFTVS